MKKYYFAMVDEFYDKRYDGLLDYEHEEITSVYLKNVVKNIRTSRGFLGIKSAEEVLEPFPIIIECEKEPNKDIESITDIITGETFNLVNDEHSYDDYKGGSNLILYLGKPITRIEVANELLRLCPDDVERYKKNMEALKRTADKAFLQECQRKLALAKQQKTENDKANVVINDFKKVYRNGK